MIIFVDVLKRFEKHENWKLKNVYGIESGCFQRSNPGDIRLFGLISFISTHFILVLFECSVYLRRFHMLHSKLIMIAWDKIVCSVVDLFIIILVPFFLCTLWAHEFVLFEFIWAWSCIVFYSLTVPRCNINIIVCMCVDYICRHAATLLERVYSEP